MDHPIYPTELKIILSIGFVVDVLIVIFAIVLEYYVLLYLFSLAALFAVLIVDRMFGSDERAEKVKNEAASIASSITILGGLITGILLSIFELLTIGITVIFVSLVLLILRTYLTFWFDQKSS